MSHVNRTGNFLKLFMPSCLHFPKEQINENSLPLRIGTNVSIKKYNKFLKRKAPRGYKYKHDDNGNVFIIKMSNEECASLSFYLTTCFNVYNGIGPVSLNRPINISYDALHYSPTRGRALGGRRRKIAADLAIAPNVPFVPKPTVAHPGPPPSNTNGNSYARIVVELGNHQSTREWIEKCELWMQEVYVRYVFAIKLHKPKNTRDNQGRKHRAMTARLYTQGAGEAGGAGCQQWDFGSIPKGARIRRGHPTPATGCTGPGHFVINIPVSEVFYNPPTIPPPAGYFPIAMPARLAINNTATFSIDLYNIQQEVLSKQKN